MNIAERVQLVIQYLEQKKPFCHFDEPYQIAIIEQMALVIQNLLNHCYIELGTYYLIQFKVKSHHLLIGNYLNFFQFRLISLKGLSKLLFCMMDLFDVVEPGWEAKIS